MSTVIGKESSKCGLCGGDILLASSDEGTNYYIPETEALKRELSALREENEKLKWANKVNSDEHKQYEAALRAEIGFIREERERWADSACQLETMAKRYREALIEISKPAGPFPFDPFEHAKECIQTMKDCAKQALFDEKPI